MLPKPTLKSDASASAAANGAAAGAARTVPIDDDRLSRARAGDGAAFGDLVRRHQAMVVSMAFRIVGNGALAEELAQDVFLQLHRSLPTLESGAHVVHWLRRVVSHRAIDSARQRKRRPQASLEQIAEPAGLPARDVDPLMTRQLRSLVDALPPAPRAVIALRFQEDLDPSEIARVLDMPVNTVKSHLRRALAVLRGRAEQLKLMESAK